MIFEHTFGDQRLKLTTTGAAVMEWDPGVGYSVWDGYQSEAEISEGDGARGGVLIPWPNRIAGAEWDDGGARRSVRRTSGPEGMHGLVLSREFEASADGGAVTFRVRVEELDAFPVPFEARVTYDLSTPMQLGILVEAENLGDRPAPFGIGLHPYFKIAGLDQAAYHVDGRQRIVVDDAGIPLPGNEPFAPYDGKPLVPNDDYAVTGLATDDDGWAYASLESGLDADIRVGMDVAAHPLANFQVFSGGDLHRDPNQAVAVEPCTIWADVFNRPELAQKIQVEPGETQQLRVQIEVLA